MTVTKGWRDAQELWDAAAANQLEVLLKCLAKGAEVRWSPERGTTALHAAASRGFLDACKALCRHDPSLVEVPDDDGNTPIVVAKYNQQPHVAYFLESVTARPPTQDLPGPRDPNFYSTGGMHSRRVALVLGQAHYKCQSIHHAASDAQILSRRLQDLRFEVFVGVNLSRVELIRQFEDFASHVGPQDFALVYYTGLASRVGRNTVLLGVDRMFAVKAEPMLTVEHITQTLLQRSGPGGVVSEEERGPTAVFVNACYGVKDSSGAPIVMEPWLPGEPEAEQPEPFNFAELQRTKEPDPTLEQPELGSTSLARTADGHLELQFDYGRSRGDWHVYEKFQVKPNTRDLGTSSNDKFLGFIPPEPLDFRRPWKTPIAIPAPMPRYESPATRIFAQGFRCPIEASPVLRPPPQPGAPIEQRDKVDLIREDGLHPVNVQGRSRAVVVYSHYPSEFLHEDLFEPHLWVNGQSLLQPQESQVPALLNRESNTAGYVQQRLEPLPPRLEDAPASSTHWVMPKKPSMWPHAVVEDHLARFGGDYREARERPSTALEQLPPDGPPPSIFGAAMEETLGQKLYLRESLLKLGSLVGERSGRIQVPFVSLGTGLNTILL
jgi:hypothetical protein